MRVKGKSLKRFDLYLDEVTDERLIKHLEGFTRNRRMNEEIRRMLYAVLDGQVGARTMPLPPPRMPQIATEASNGLTVDTPAEPNDVKAKMRKAFGGFGGQD